MIPANFIGAHKPLTAADIITEAGQLHCTTAIVHAFSDLESGGSGFLSSGAPKVLFEARYFHLKTGGKYDNIAPNLSSRIWDRSLYGAGGQHQLDRVIQAMRLDRDAALQSCSLGKYQTMVANYKMAGFSSAEDMWTAFCDDEMAHLIAFGNFIKSAHLQDEMQSNPPKFLDLAVGYNGAGEAANGYHQKLETSFFHYVALGEGVVPTPSGIPSHADEPQTPPPLPASPDGHITRVLHVGAVGADVGLLQSALHISVDNRYGTLETKPAVIAYQRSHGLKPVDGIAGKDTLTSLGLWA